ncbi:MAG: glycosyltransferase [Rhodospirillaceae bacterium]|nr:glycosyltransferase [Rhodospirillaceae bacterium]
MFSVIIPTLNAAAGLETTLAALAEAKASDGQFEIVVVDGGSHDGTPDLAARLGARLIAAPRGRGVQLAAGAKASCGPWLLFLHADTVLEPGWSGAARTFIARPTAKTEAAAFRFALDDDAPVARRLEKAVAWRCRVIGLPYGDQGLLIHRDFYDSLGGYRTLPLMEDVDFIRRVGRRRIVMLDKAAVTSAARYRCDGYLRRGLRNLLCLSLYLAGVPPRHILRVYG